MWQHCRQGVSAGLCVFVFTTEDGLRVCLRGFIASHSPVIMCVSARGCEEHGGLVFFLLIICTGDLLFWSDVSGEPEGLRVCSVDGGRMRIPSTG